MLFWKRHIIQAINICTDTRNFASDVLEHSETLKASVASRNSSKEAIAALYLAAASVIVSPVKKAARNCIVADNVDGRVGKNKAS
jgi:hypothetical protein